MYDEMDRREYDYRDDRGRNYRDDYREDYRDYRDYRDEYGRNQRDRYGRNRRTYRNYRSDEYRECLEDMMDDTRELAREFEDVSEMATNSSEKQKLMQMAQREKEHHKYLKEMIEK
jgi:hypothetical protein